MTGFLGLKDATIKRRPITQSPSEWTGSIVRDIEGVGLFVTFSQKKWDRVKGILEPIMRYFSKANDRPELD